MKSFCIKSTSASDTSRIASALAPFLRSGDIIVFKGALASGKTHFIKSLSMYLGCNDLVTSPTYTLANFYQTSTCDLLHIDVYRLESIDEFRNLGLEEYFDESITFVEWGDKVIRDFQEYLLVELQIDPSEQNQRNIMFSAQGERWDNRLESLPKLL